MLSSAFWLHIYANERLSREALEETLSENEPSLAFLVDERAGLDFVYARLAFLFRHPCIAFWFVFWHDFWEQNCRMDAVAAQAELLDPQHASALCYRPMKRRELEAALEQAGLRGGDRLVSEDILERMYAQMEAHLRAFNDTGPTSVAVVGKHESKWVYDTEGNLVPASDVKGGGEAGEEDEDEDEDEVDAFVKGSPLPPPRERDPLKALVSSVRSAACWLLVLSLASLAPFGLLAACLVPRRAFQPRARARPPSSSPNCG